MKANCYTQFLADAAHRFRHFAAKASEKADEDAIHEFRVAVKEIEAFHKPLLRVACADEMRMLEHWRNRADLLYKPAGKLRNGHMMHKLGLHSGIWQLLPEHEQLLIEKIESRKTNFLALAKEDRFPHINKSLKFLKSLSPQMHQLVDDAILDLFKQALPLLVLPAGLHWHEARRDIKCAYYLLQAQKQCSTFDNDSQLLLTGIMEKELGRWHDWTLLQSFIRQPDLNHVALQDEALQIVQQHLNEVENRIVERVKLLDANKKTS